MGRVLLVSMPFGALDRPALGLSLIKARLVQEDGVDCDIRYLTFPFAELIGGEEYYWVSTDLPHTAFVGEWIFTAALYGHSSSADSSYVREVLQNGWRLDAGAIERIQRIRAMVPHFLDHCVAVVRWQDYALVGFTSTFEQNIASLALAKRIKDAYPRISIVFGGANWEDEMGVELHRRFPFVDYACPGEADESFPALIRSVLSGGSRKSVRKIRGLVYRANGKTAFTGRSALVRDMDALPIPDYSDYFRALDRSPAASFVVPSLLFEGSRGCWWGAKSQCMFCGLNGETLHFRSKGAERALHEIEYLVDRWKIDMVQAVDNILDMRWFTDLLPALSSSGRGIRFFFEVKSNLNREQVRLLSEANVLHVQPGIESLSDHVLQLMRKGTTALRNIQLLKWCKEHGVRADWNILYGFPGETREDYAEMMQILPAIRFLNPPNACGPIRLDRFSPYYTAPEEFGLRNLRPVAPYKHLYPFDEGTLSKIAYYFDYDYAPHLDPTGYADEVVAYGNDWKENPETGTLCAVERPDGKLVLLDSRSNAARPEFTLGGLDREVYEYCDQARSTAAVGRYVSAARPGVSLGAAQVARFLDALVANRLMITHNGQYLSLALRGQPPARAGGDGQRTPEHAAPAGQCASGALGGV